jgi:hypothetical protein
MREGRFRGSRVDIFFNECDAGLPITPPPGGGLSSNAVTWLAKVTGVPSAAGVALAAIPLPLISANAKTPATTLRLIMFLLVSVLCSNVPLCADHVSWAIAHRGA